MRRSINIPRPLTPPKPTEIPNRMITRNRSSFTTADITTTRTNPREWNIFHRRHRYITRITVRRNGNMDCAGALTNAGFVAPVGGVLASSLEGPGIACTILRWTGILAVTEDVWDTPPSARVCLPSTLFSVSCSAVRSSENII